MESGDTDFRAYVLVPREEHYNAALRRKEELRDATTVTACDDGEKKRAGAASYTLVTAFLKPRCLRDRLQSSLEYHLCC
jgi:hypothetical protein